MKTIILECGTEVLIDDEDYAYITECYNLHIDTNGYVICRPKKKWKRMGLFSMSLHKILANPDKRGRKVVVDHRDGNTLNNCRDNLRVCTQQENMFNRKKNRTNNGQECSSNYKGVAWNTENKKWRVIVSAESYQREHVGYYTNEIAAANVYNHVTQELFGEFAKLNDVPYMSREECEKYNGASKKTSKYRGISFSDNRWVAQIYHKGKNIQIGRFIEEKDAAEAYNEKAIELKGEKAKLNEI